MPEELPRCTPSDIRRSGHGWGWKRRLRYVAVAALIVLILALAACAIPAVRQAAIDFFIKDAGDHFAFTYDPEKVSSVPHCIETVYVPTYIPEGFTLVDEMTSPAGVARYYTNEDGIPMCFDQYVIPENPSSGEGGGPNSEGAEAEFVTLSEITVLRTEDDEWIHYYWTTAEYRFSVSVNDRTMEAELQKFFLGIREDPDAIPGDGWG